MLVRFNVNVLDYHPGDVVELPKGWSDILVPSHATEVVEEKPAAAAEPEAKKAEPAKKAAASKK